MLINCCLKPSETFQGVSERPFTTVDVKNLIFWAAYSVPDLFNQKHKPFIFRVLVDENRLLTQAGHGCGRLEKIHGVKIF